ncbi:MAG: hypothetical protein E7600_04045 [Ruminococcaceae bacterium]|nr:hypothetical protein [Oscillospiraceae bacterium]
MQKLVDLLNEKELKYADELFFADGEFFAIHDGVIAKLPDFTGDFEGIYKLLPSTEHAIATYIIAENLDITDVIYSISIFANELELYGDEIPEGLDYDALGLLICCQEKGISPYRAYKAMLLIMEDVQSGVWTLLGYDGEYKQALEYISEACEVIDFRYTDEYDDEYWESIIENIESYVFSGGEVF